MANKALQKPKRKLQPIRPKLDPRLSYLMSMSQARIRAIRSEETRERKRLAEEHHALASSNLGPQGAGREHEARLADLERRHFMSFTAGVHLRDRPAKRRKPSDEPRVSALVLCDGNADDLRRLGARVRSNAGDVFTVSASFSAIRRLEDSSIVRYVELARESRSDLDHAVPFAGMKMLHDPPLALKGKGVIVGILDSKLDFYHPDFCSGAKSSRVLFLWDQTLTPRRGEKSPPTGAALPGFAPTGGRTYGVEYSKKQIDRALATFRRGARNAYGIVRHEGEPNVDSDHLHGTHVTSVAAGNGRADQDRRFTGAAPEADLIFVGLQKPAPDAPVADSAALLDAFAYVFARAAQLGKPCVVNRSGSDNQGPHDGMTLGERFLDNLLSIPGRAITLAAGNSNQDNSHAAGDVTPGRETKLRLHYDAEATNNDDIEIWYDGHDRFDVTVTVPTKPPTLIGPISPGFSETRAVAPNCEVQVSSTLNDPRNGDNQIALFITLSDREQIPEGDWVIGLSGTTAINGRFHAWVDRNNRGKCGWRTHLQNDVLTLGVPATARRPIAVGAHDKRKPHPAIVAESGRGATRDGRVKPDIAATGARVMAARLRNMNEPPPTEGPYLAAGGTSVSAPLVAGACALLFESRGPDLSCADLKQILQMTAGTEGIGTVPNSGFGFGFLQMQHVERAPKPEVDVWLRDSVDDTGLEPFAGTVAWLSPDIEVLDAHGKPVANPSHDHTRRFSNIIRVTVRNRGAQAALNTEVFLYWAEPATSLRFPEAWKSSGIFVGRAPNFAEEGNSVVVPVLAPGKTAQVQFAWAPSAHGNGLHRHDQFSLLVRLENQADPSQIGGGGWVAITAKNNLALRNVHVQPLRRERSEMRFYLVGTPEEDSLRVERGLAGGRVELRIPGHVLRWRDAKFIGIYGGRDEHYSTDELENLRVLRMELKGSEVERRLDVHGARSLHVRDGIATIELDNAQPLMWLKRLRLPNGSRIPATVSVTNARIGKDKRCVHVAQFSEGRLAGGVSLELRPPSEFRMPQG